MKKNSQIQTRPSAKEIFDKYPSWENYKDRAIQLRAWDGIANGMYNTSPSEYHWESMTWLADKILQHVRGFNITDGYFIQIKRNVISGNGTLVAASGEKVELPGIDFLLCLKIVLAGWLEMPIADELLLLTDDYKMNNDKVARVLD